MYDPMRRFPETVLTALLVAAISGACDSTENSATTKESQKSKRYLFYLHGKIVEDKGIRPESANFGYYEYDKILSTLKKQGFTVKSEARPKNTDPKKYAEKIAAEVRALFEKGIPESDITVVGASKGGTIALYVSNLLKKSRINYVILAGLFKPLLDDPALKLYGHVLSIHDSADTLPLAPKSFIERSKGLGEHRYILVHKGLGHGLLYKPYDEWVKPLVEWVK